VSLLDRIIDSLHALFYSQKRSVSVGSRFIAVAAVILTVTTVFPTLAEELLPPTEVVQSSTPQTEPTTESSAEPVAEQPEPEASAIALDDSAALSEEEEAKAEEERKAEEAKVKVASVQPQINFRFPNSIALDPRASVANLPQLALTGGSMGLLCLSSNGIIDINSKGSSNNIAVAPPVAKSGDKEVDASAEAAAKANKSALQVAGDLTSFIRVSGSLNQINELINSAGGLRVTASQGRAVGSNLTARYVELTGSDLSPDFCGKAANQRSITFRALGLQMETVKTRVDFNKPSGK
jgi:chemotaxis protein histidine kinase CheA